MNEMKTDMMQKARERYQRIFPCASRGNLNECFTLEGSRLYFWFNTEDDSTHVMYAEV